MSQSVVNLHLHPKQGEVLLSSANEILYGGAAGGGKSHLVRVLLIMLCSSIPGFQAYLFRRHHGDLDKNHMKGPKGFSNMLLPWLVTGQVQIVKGEIRFWNGSIIHLCHCKNPDDVSNYMGAEMHALFIDEANQFTDWMVRMLRMRLRVPGLAIPPEWKARLPLLILTANPIGVGVAWLKDWFIHNVVERSIRRMPNSEGGMLRQFILARLEDNPSMQTDDPAYEAKLEGLGSPALVKAMRLGDWSAIEGAYFPNFMRTVIKPFEIPPHWNRFVSFDWGGARPFSVGWWAVSSGDGANELAAFRPDELIRYREWYGCEKKPDGTSIPNKGIQMDNADIARGILAREAKGENIVWRVADPSIFARRGAPSIAEDMAAAGVTFSAANNDRVQGWRQMLARHNGMDGRPMSWVFDTCTDSIRTIPYLVNDAKRVEDLDTEGEDHCADDHRYGFMSRPWSAPVIQQEKPRAMDEMTFEELMAKELRDRFR